MAAAGGMRASADFAVAVSASSLSFAPSARSRRTLESLRRVRRRILHARLVAGSVDRDRFLGSLPVPCSVPPAASAGRAAGGGAAPIEGAGNAGDAIRASLDGAGSSGCLTPGATAIESATAVAAAVAGTRKRKVRLAGHQDWRSTGGAVRAMADRTAWHRAHPAACPSAAARTSAGNTPTNSTRRRSRRRDSARRPGGLFAQRLRQETVHRSLARVLAFVVHQFLII